MTLSQAAYEINERIQKEQSFKKYLGEDKKTLNIEFYEYEIPSITFAFDRSTFDKIKKIISILNEYS